VTDRLVIATRGSALALWQAEHVKARIAAVAPDVAVTFNVIKTSGDQILDVPRSAARASSSRRSSKRSSSTKPTSRSTA
jgi:porphobilinogen deaminase